MSEAEWSEIVDRQLGLCAVCALPLAGGRTCIDHEHVRGWKRLRPQYRKRYVRGVLHSFCNSHVVGRFVTLAKALRVVRYLQEHEKRKACEQR